MRLVFKGRAERVVAERWVLDFKILSWRAVGAEKGGVGGRLRIRGIVKLAGG